MANEITGRVICFMVFSCTGGAALAAHGRGVCATEVAPPRLFLQYGAIVLNTFHVKSAATGAASRLIQTPKRAA